jgi:ubiquinone/menaquinone biosynthesis C-methylase UbiE
MLFLSAEESRQWNDLGIKILNEELELKDCLDKIRSNLAPAFHFYCGNLLFSKDKKQKGMQAFTDGALIEEDGLFSNAFIASFLKRHDLKLEMPAVCFEDPQPFVHFTTTPELKKARENFVKFFAHTLPDFKKPFSIMDIGTGNGALLADILKHLKTTGKISEIDEVLLIDPSPAMLELATETVAETIPREKIKKLNSKVQDATRLIDRKYDVALSSLAYHHMPYEDKETHLNEIKDRFDHFIIFEINSDNDSPELNTPEMALAVYQSYGRVIDFIFAHDTDLKTAQTAVDNFLMTEEISFLTQPRGKRSDYHMLRRQWLKLFDSALTPEFKLLGDCDCYADDFLTLIALHCGKR